VIHLDANYLIRGSVVGSEQNIQLKRLLTSGEAVSTSVIAWMEFVTGPVRAEVVESVRQVLEDRIVPLTRDEAELAASLFNLVGRKRALRYDCLIAATAIQAGARLATANQSDFDLFVPHGLEFS
jgi:predicted nucleic acid-binding protein